MPLRVLGCTPPSGLFNRLTPHRDVDRRLQLLISNDEFLVSASQQPVLNMPLPFVRL